MLHKDQTIAIRFGACLMRWFVTAAVLLMSTSLAMADLVYFDDFDGASFAMLHATTPDVSVWGNFWLADPDFTADGGRGERSGSMDGEGECDARVYATIGLSLYA